MSKEAKANKHSPIFLEIILHSFYLGYVQLESDSRKKFYYQAIKDELITPAEKTAINAATHEVRVQLTAKGIAFIRMLQSTPLPVAHTEFVDPRFIDGKVAE